MKSIIIIIASFILLLDAAAPAQCKCRAHSDKAHRSDNVTGALIKFAANIWSNIYLEPPYHKNLLISPISIHQALSMVALGANKDGHSRKELLKVLNYDDPEKAGEDYKKLLAEFRKLTEAALKVQSGRGGRKKKSKGYQTANIPPVIDIWSSLISVNEKKYKESYLEATKEYYNSTPEVVPNGDKKAAEKVCDKVNNWAKEAGFGDKVLTVDELTGDPDLAGVILTAIRFQAAWFEKFHKEKGKDIFYNHGKKEQVVKEGDILTAHSNGFGSYIKLDERHQKPRRLKSRASKEELDELASCRFHVVDVPLDGEVSFSIIRPLNGTLKKLTGDLTANANSTSASATSGLHKLIHLLEEMKGTNNIRRLTFPVFKFESSLNMVDTLTKAGIKRIFDRGQAQLEALMDDPRLYVSDVRHQAMVETSEFGIKAAAITKLSIARESADVGPGKEDIRVKEPFMFLIRHSKTLLFIGQVIEL